MGLAFSLHIPAIFGIRFLLGFTESIVGPGLLAITVQWYLKSVRVVPLPRVSYTNFLTGTTCYRRSLAEYAWSQQSSLVAAGCTSCLILLCSSS